MTRAPQCLACGAGEISPKSRMGSPLCARCLPAQAHAVSIQNAADGDRLAVCPCGWTFKAYRSRETLADQDEAIRTHWQIVVAQAHQSLAMLS